MKQKQAKKLQTAQGMVEFALVLPILLLVILGIFAFGHMFFVYSSVVSASREAARWGAAVGEAPSAAPRYMDCDAIRATAVRLGAFAGVNSTNIDGGSDTGIEIQYDNGPDAAGNSIPYASCPAGGSGPADVVMGDRIVVRVKVDYTPIVPFVNLPSFPLEATTFRTILRSVPVGEAPTAVDPCTSSTHIELDTLSSVVGEKAQHSIRVVADDNQTDSPPVGEVYLYDDAETPYMCEGMLTPETEDASYFVCPDPGSYPAYEHVGGRAIRVVYTSDDTCFLSTSTEGGDPIHMVNPALTDLQISVSPNPGKANNSMTVTVTVVPVAPGAGVPQGFVLITFPGQAERKVDLVNAVGTTIFVPTSAMTNQTLTVVYPDSPVDADPDFIGKTKTTLISVQGATPLPTFTATTGNLPTPTKTPLPSWCPQFASSVSIVGPYIDFSITNPNEKNSAKTNVTGVVLDWPSDPAAYVQQIQFGTVGDTCTTGNKGNCLWSNIPDGLSPTHQEITSSTTGWDNSFASMNKGTTKAMRLGFSRSLEPGTYHFIIRFDHGNCQLETTYEKTQ